MKKIGIIGGLGPEPTIEYYRIITGHFHNRSKGYPRIVIYSMDVYELGSMFEEENYPEVVETLLEGIGAVSGAGADFGLIAANTPHIVFDEVQKKTRLPLLSIVSETLKEVKGAGFSRAGLLGTKYTMRSDLFQKEFAPAGLDIFVPEETGQEYIQEKIYSEIARGRFLDSTRDGLLEIIKRLIDDHHIECVILGCTELPLILDREEFGIPFLNTTRIHAESAIRYCLSENG